MASRQSFMPVLQYTLHASCRAVVSEGYIYALGIYMHSAHIVPLRPYLALFPSALMAQGNPKLNSQKSSAKRVSAQQPKKGRRTIPPKKQAAVKHAAHHNSLSSKINKSIESQILASASGEKLSILKPSAPFVPFLSSLSNLSSF